MGHDQVLLQESQVLVRYHRIAQRAKTGVDPIEDLIRIFHPAIEVIPAYIDLLHHLVRQNNLCSSRADLFKFLPSDLLGSNNMYLLHILKFENSSTEKKMSCSQILKCYLAEDKRSTSWSVVSRSCLPVSISLRVSIPSAISCSPTRATKGIFLLLA